MNLNYRHMQMMETFQPLMLGSLRQYFTLASYFTQNNTNRRQMVKTLAYDNPDHKTKLKIRQFQVMGKSTGQINNTGYEWYIGS